MQSAAPSTNATAFSCPHCGAYTTQQWFYLFGRQYGDDNRTPSFDTAESREYLATAREIPDEIRPGLLEWCDQIMRGLPFFEVSEKGEYVRAQLRNLAISECYNCKKLAVWVHQSLVFPFQLSGPNPNPDLPPHIASDFEEARSIVNASPRGAAALLRLAVQKLCAHLGEKGKNIDDDISSLVAKGLDPIVQQSLDIVRVIGNEAVHPGVIDLRDEPNVASSLFELVNAITQQMITHPNSVKALYNNLPEGKRQAIEARNTKARG